MHYHKGVSDEKVLSKGRLDKPTREERRAERARKEKRKRQSLLTAEVSFSRRPRHWYERDTDTAEVVEEIRDEYGIPDMDHMPQ